MTWDDEEVNGFNSHAYERLQKYGGLFVQDVGSALAHEVGTLAHTQGISPRNAGVIPFPVGPAVFSIGRIKFGLNFFQVLLYGGDTYLKPTRQTFTALCLALATCGLGCGEKEPYWKPGSTYRIELQAPREPSGVARSRQGHGFPITALLRLDSIVHDSLYGTYSTVRGNIRTVLTPADDKPGEVYGLMRGDSAQFGFEPRVNDGNLRLAGILHGARVTGTWWLMALVSKDGRFTLRRE